MNDCGPDLDRSVHAATWNALILQAAHSYQVPFRWGDVADDVGCSVQRVVAHLRAWPRARVRLPGGATEKRLLPATIDWSVAYQEHYTRGALPGWVDLHPDDQAALWDAHG